MDGDVNKHIRRALEAAALLYRLADDTDAETADNGCTVVGGVMRDCAYQIRAMAQREQEVHKRRGLWRERG
jgi:hypothetical protein